MVNHVSSRFIGRSALLVGAVVVALLIGRSSALASGSGASAEAPQHPQAYCKVYEQALASALKVSVAQLAEANKVALQKVIQQASSDGTITQTQATNLLNSVKHMGSDPCTDLARVAATHHAKLASAHMAVASAVASALKLTPETLKNDLASGMTIPEIASAQHVRLSDVNTAYLDAVQTQLKTAVSNGDISQTQADKIYSSIQRAVAAGHYPLLGAHT